jgi:hypothetical protein
MKLYTVLSTCMYMHNIEVDTVAHTVCSHTKSSTVQHVDIGACRMTE